MRSWNEQGWAWGVSLCAAFIASGCGVERESSADTHEPEPSTPGATECGPSIEAYSQADIDALAGCEVIIGSLRIQSDDDLDLRPLGALRSVGSLQVFGPTEGATGILSLEGLENLRVVRNELTLGGLRISSLAPLANLRIQASEDEPLDFTLEISGCDALESLAGLQLGSYIEDFNVTYNAGLKTLDPWVYEPPPAPGMLISLDLSGNPLLSDLDALAALTEAGSVYLDDTPYENLAAFAGLRRVAGYFDVAGNQNLVDLSLPNLEAVGVFTINANPKLVELGAFDRLDGLRLLEVSDNPELARLPRFPALTGDASAPDWGWAELAIHGNPKLESVDGFVSLVSSGGIDIRGNASLSSVELGALTEIVHGPSSSADGHLRIIDNSSLASLRLPLLTSIVVGLEIKSNPQLPAADLAPLATLSTRIEIEGNQAEVAP
jgi:hypothetical protein